MNKVREMPPPLPSDPRLRDTEEYNWTDSPWFFLAVGVIWLLFVFFMFAMNGVLK